MTLTATATGCASADYEWWVMPPGGQWTLLLPYPSSAMADMTTATAGTWYLAVTVRASGSTSPGDAAAVLVYTFTAAGSPAGLAARLSGPLPAPPTPGQASGTNAGVALPVLRPRVAPPARRGG